MVVSTPHPPTWTLGLDEKELFCGQSAPSCRALEAELPETEGRSSRKVLGGLLCAKKQNGSALTLTHSSRRRFYQNLARPNVVRLKRVIAASSGGP